jgi:hypothetical protein
MQSFEGLNLPEITLTEDVLPRVPLDEVLRIQSLTMSVIRPICRTRRREPDPRVNKFVLLHETTPGVTNPSELMQRPNALGEYEADADVDTYLGVVVRKPGPRRWRFTVSFLQYVLIDSERLNSTRDLYRFEWERDDDEVLGIRRVIRNAGKVVSANVVDAPEGVVFERVERRMVTVEPSVVSIQDCHALQAKIVNHADLFLGLDENSTAA